MDDWKEFAMELWGLSVSTWDPIPERAGKLPEPLEYDIIHDGLIELETGERCLVIQTVSGYQVGVKNILNYFCLHSPCKTKASSFNL
jgi:hypothetical protein